MSKDMLGSLTRALVAVPQKWLGLLIDIVNKMMSNDGENFYRELAKFVRNWKSLVETKVTQFPVWKTVKLGIGLTTADDFRTAIKQAGFRIGDWANDILGKPAFTVSEVEMELDLVNISVAELGFENGATRKEVYDRAIELGLALCPNEVGPQLRLQYKDQPRGEWFIVAMEPISDSVGDLEVFFLAHRVGGLWLYCGNGHPGFRWVADTRFVFVRPR